MTDHRVSRELLAAVRLVVFDFDGVFTDNFVYVDQSGVESVRCWRSDGIGLGRLRSVGVHALIISTETNPVVTARAQKLKVTCRQGVDDKRNAVLEACKELDVDPAAAMFVANDVNDIPALQSVGVPVAVADAYPEVLPHVLFQTERRGGHGAVREICDMIFQVKVGD